MNVHVVSQMTQGLLLGGRYISKLFYNDWNVTKRFSSMINIFSKGSSNGGLMHDRTLHHVGFPHCSAWYDMSSKIPGVYRTTMIFNNFRNIATKVTIFSSVFFHGTPHRLERSSFIQFSLPPSISPRMSLASMHFHINCKYFKVTPHNRDTLVIEGESLKFLLAIIFVFFFVSALRERPFHISDSRLALLWFWFLINDLLPFLFYLSAYWCQKTWKTCRATIFTWIDVCTLQSPAPWFPIFTTSPISRNLLDTLYYFNRWLPGHHAVLFRFTILSSNAHFCL